MNFNVLSENLLDFTECISIINNEIGIVDFDTKDFETVIEDSRQVNFFTASGEDVVALANELKSNVNHEGNLLLVITTNGFGNTAVPFDEAFDILSGELSESSVFYYNVYERTHQEQYKAYIFSTAPN